MEKMHLCILETGASNPKLVEKFGRYTHMIENWLKPAIPEAKFTVCSVFQGEALDLENHHFSGFIVTGSPHGVYEELPWIKTLEQQLKQIAQQGLPIFGICFGHQIMAQAFGGKVEKSKKGWGIGIQKYKFFTPELKDGNVLVYHQDQVVSPPPKAKIIGASEHCAYGAIEYPFAARSIQFHPEFSNEFVSELIVFRNDPIDDQAEQLKALKEINIDSTAVAQWAANFFRQHQPQKII